MSRTVHLYPVPGAFVHHAPSIEQDVDEETAQELLSYSPPAFTIEAPTNRPHKPTTRRPRKAPRTQEA